MLYRYGEALLTDAERQQLQPAIGKYHHDRGKEYSRPCGRMQITLTQRGDKISSNAQMVKYTEKFKHDLQLTNPL